MITPNLLQEGIKENEAFFHLNTPLNPSPCACMHVHVRTYTRHGTQIYRDIHV